VGITIDGDGGPAHARGMGNVQHPPHAELEKLDDSGLELDDYTQDLRGRKVVDRDGAQIGHVSNLFIDRSERKVRMLEIRTGGFLGIGERHVVLPIDSILRVSKDLVTVRDVRAFVAASPAYDPKLVVDPRQEAWAPFYGYYGVTPYWDGAYTYPRYPEFDDVPR
jgi:sporulation protein YlmC with PRC-barrel domain